MDEILESVEDREEWEKDYATAVYSQQAYEGWLEQTGGESDWQIKKFADKLKDMTCLLIGCTREDLENRDFKETPLGKNWTEYTFKYGEDFEETMPYYGSYEEAFAELISVARDKYNRDVMDISFTCIERKLTPRKILQLLGTEGVRNSIHKNAWVNSLMSEYIPSCNSYEVSVRPSGDIKTPLEYPKWIVTDMRFPNELKAIKDKSGISIRINRTNVGRACTSDLEENMNTIFHPSETALDNATFDYIIENDGTIDELIVRIRNILIDLKIIEQ